MWLCCVDADLHAWDSPSAEGRGPLGCPPGRRRLPRCSCVGSGPSSSVGRTPGPRRSSLKEHTNQSSIQGSLHRDVLAQEHATLLTTTAAVLRNGRPELLLSSSSAGFCKKRLLTVMTCWECRVVPGSVRPCQECADTTGRLVHSSGFRKHNTNKTQKFCKPKQRQPGEEEAGVPREEQSRRSGNEDNPRQRQ